MDHARFDRLVRHLSETRSRRRLLRGLIGTGLAGLPPVLGARDGAARCGRFLDKCKRNRDCCSRLRCVNGRCDCKPGLTECTRRCNDLQTDPAHCGFCGNRCAEGQICAAGTCVTGRGTCPAGADSCARLGATFQCDNNGSCFCFRSTEGETRCGTDAADEFCGQCQSSADCAALYPDAPGAFCVKDTGPNCICGDGQGICHLPCPT